jgi:hypothetical protein
MRHSRESDSARAEMQKLPTVGKFHGALQERHSLPGRRTYRESLYLQSVLNRQFLASDVASISARTSAPGTALTRRERAPNLRSGQDRKGCSPDTTDRYGARLSFAPY